MCISSFQSNDGVCGNFFGYGLLTIVISLYHFLIMSKLLLFIVVMTGSGGILDGPCLPSDRCFEDNTFCNNGICKCDTYHFDKNRKCGEYNF